jgi:hypothetical protein
LQQLKNLNTMNDINHPAAPGPTKIAALFSLFLQKNNSAT